MLTLLAHGLGRTPVSMFGLAAFLRRGGHRTRFFGYSPTFESFPGIVDRLTRTLRDLSRLGQPVTLVGHSLGGLLLRIAVPSVPELRVHHLVMLGTPNSPPRMGRLAWRWRPFRWLTGGCGRFLASEKEYDRVPGLAVPCTVFAGTAGPQGKWGPFASEPNDGVVAVSETRAAGTTEVLVPAYHSFMMDAGAVQSRILAMINSAEPVSRSPVHTG